MSFDDAVADLLDGAAARNFTQSVDLVINVRDLDLDDPDNRFSTEINLPYTADDDTAVCVIGETITANASNADRTIAPDELDEIMDDQQRAKEFDFFIAEAPLMPKIGQNLGSVLGPRNKMPEPMQPGEDPTDRIRELRSAIPITLKEEPSIKCKIGSEEMDENELSENAAAVYEAVTGHLPRSDHNIKDVYVKLTMSSPVEVDV
ncbi:MAG: 50S ribosomal protein L1 [Candidatus Nanohaloarchaea archaeon]